MIFPTVHMNGTCGDILSEQLMEAGRAVAKAIDKVIDAFPNARDYYVAGPDAYPQARLEWEARKAALQTVYDELCELCGNVADQEIDRDERRSGRR